MSEISFPPPASPRQQEGHNAAQRWVRKLRILYTVVGAYAALSLMWFAIDMADGTENVWFYWPMLGTGVVVAVISVVLVGVGGLFGIDWERRQVDRYLHGHSSPTVE
jgi:hypothetical protein